MGSETNENVKQSQDGWYKHKDTGAIVHLQDDTTYGVPLTNSFIKAGYVFVSSFKEDPRVPEVKEDKPKLTKKEG